VILNVCALIAVAAATLTTGVEPLPTRW